VRSTTPAARADFTHLQLTLVGCHTSVLGFVVFDSALWLTPRLLLSAFVAATTLVVDGKRFRIIAASSAGVMVVALVAYISFAGFV
jgi:hypothetical protein